MAYMAVLVNKSKAAKILKATVDGNVRQMQMIKKLRKLDEDTLALLKNSSYGHGLLHAGAGKGMNSVCKYLLEELKHEVDEKDNDGSTPLALACAEGYLSTVEYLIEYGADPAALNSFQTTALHFAAINGNTEIMNLLLSKGVDVNAISDLGTPLQMAAQFCNQEVFKVLLDNGADPNLDGANPSPLDYCVPGRSIECAKLLLQAGADPNGSPCLTKPLASAAREGDIEFVKYLYQKGADPNLMDDVGRKPIDIAAENGHQREVEFLFPITTPNPMCSDWSITGIMKYVHSEEANKQITQMVKAKHLRAIYNGEQALEESQYVQAIYFFTEAIESDPSDATGYMNRSRCFAHVGHAESAWSDARACIMLRPDWAEAHYIAGITLSMLKEVEMAAEAFHLGLKLDPQNKDYKEAYKKNVEEQRYLSGTSGQGSEGASRK